MRGPFRAAAPISTKRPSKNTCIAMRNRHRNAWEAFQSKTLDSWVSWQFPKTRSRSLMQNAAAHKIKFMTLRGEKLRYGRGDIYRYSLQEEQEEQW